MEVGEPIDSLAFAPNGMLVATASRDGAEQIWDARSGTLVSQFNTLRTKILSIEFDPTSKLVAAACASGAVVVTDAQLGMPVATLEGPKAVVRTARFEPSSRRIVGASWDGTARVWDATSPYRRWSSPPVSDDCGLEPSLEPDRRFIAIGCRGRGTLVWDTAHDQFLAELPGVTPVDGDFSSAIPAVSANGDRAAIARGNTVERYELPGGRLLRTIEHGAPVSSVAFAATGHDFVSGATDGSLLITRDDREPLALPTSDAGIEAAVILPTGRVVVADARRHLRVYATADRGSLLVEIEVLARMGSLQPSPDGRRLIAIPSFTGPEGPPALLDLERYRVLARLEGHVGWVFSAHFVEGRERDRHQRCRWRSPAMGRRIGPASSDVSRQHTVPRRRDDHRRWLHDRSRRR